jgi:hypothetical protein
MTTSKSVFSIAGMGVLVGFAVVSIGCSDKTLPLDDSHKVVGVNASYFLTDSEHLTVELVDCTLSNGVKTKCYQITSNSYATDHQMGPWCPQHITDKADKGGIWVEGGKVYNVDGVFIFNMSKFYGDDKWKMYDAEGNIYTTKTKEDCAAAARPDVDPKYANHCVECLPSYVSDVSIEYLIPVMPQLLQIDEQSMSDQEPSRRQPNDEVGGRPRPERNGPPPGGQGNRGGNQGVRGLAFNGVRFDAPAPTNAILSAYTLAPFDDAGGHINLHVGYHYHAATGKTKEITQEDGHAPLIGYAMDGVGMYACLDKDGKPATDLDVCRGHSDEVRGYHYHVSTPSSNNIIPCHKGAIAVHN